MFTALLWISILSVNTWSMIDSLNNSRYKMACFSAFALGFITLGILVKYFG